MAKKQITLSDALGAARGIMDAYAKWQMQDGPRVAWMGHPTKALSKELLETVQEATNAVADEISARSRADVEPAARRLMLCLDALAYSMKRWLQGASQGLSWAQPAGSDDTDRAFKDLEQALSTRKLPKPPPIAILEAQGAPKSTIALKYGWKLPDGSPDVDKVYEEIEAPGTHYNSDTWVHPSFAKAQAEADAAWESRAPRPALFHDDSKTAPAPQKRPIEEMIAAQAPAEQIARLYKLSVDEVHELAKIQGVDLNAQRHVKPVNEHGMHLERLEQQERTAAAVAKAQAKLNDKS